MLSLRTSMVRCSLSRLNTPHAVDASIHTRPPITRVALFLVM